mmetsp:Transcript_76098/g.246322  ORF Transcript_76098/g.246322 Transcript_76098/m.246322 type:complete len:307 (+) Transcript_76098:279-1199(+)
MGARHTGHVGREVLHSLHKHWCPQGTQAYSAGADMQMTQLPTDFSEACTGWMLTPLPEELDAPALAPAPAPCSWPSSAADSASALLLRLLLLLLLPPPPRSFLFFFFSSRGFKMTFPVDVFRGAAPACPESRLMAQSAAKLTSLPQASKAWPARNFEMPSSMRLLTFEGSALEAAIALAKSSSSSSAAPPAASGPSAAAAACPLAFCDAATSASIRALRLSALPSAPFPCRPALPASPGAASRPPPCQGCEPQPEPLDAQPSSESRHFRPNSASSPESWCCHPDPACHEAAPHRSSVEPCQQPVPA